LPLAGHLVVLFLLAALRVTHTVHMSHSSSSTRTLVLTRKYGVRTIDHAKDSQNEHTLTRGIW
jgi:hypothetical protein